MATRSTGRSSPKIMRYWCEYGTDMSYGSKTPVQTASADIARLTFALFRLTPGRTFHYRLAVEAAGEIFRGEDRTSKVPHGRGLTQARVVVENPGSIALLTRYWCEYGTDTSYGSKTPVRLINGPDCVDVTIEIDGLEPGVLYHYRVVTENTKGIKYSEDRTITSVAKVAEP
jgi:hypothetical protein